MTCASKNYRLPRSLSLAHGIVVCVALVLRVISQGVASKRRRAISDEPTKTFDELESKRGSFGT